MEEKKRDINNYPQETEEKAEEKLNLEAELKQARRALEEEKDRHLRTKADFENFRKRMAREADSARIEAKKEIILDLLTYLDYFEQARKQVQDPAAARGIEIMARQFNELLYKHGVRPVECLGQPFDPEEHEGLGYIETDQRPDGCIAEEVCRGYKLGDILLKPAQVMVAKNLESESE